MPRRAHSLPLTLLAAVLFCAMPGGGDMARANIAEPDALDDIKRQIDTSREKQKELEARSAAARKEAEAIRGKLIGAAARVQAHEADVSASEQRLQELGETETLLRSRFEQRREEMAELLLALTRLDRNPPPALAAHPDDILSALRGALLLGNVLPELQTEASDLRDKLEELAALRAEIIKERDILGEAEIALAEERRSLEKLLDQKLAVQTRLARQAESEQQRAERLSRQATDLSDLISRLEASAVSRIPMSRPEPRPEPPRTTTPPRRDEDVKPRDTEPPAQLAVLRPPAQPPTMPSSRLFSEAKGRILPPATGTITRNYGSRDSEGIRSQGLTLVTRPDAQIIAPFDGKISYAGPFRQYGQLLILSVGEGYHVLLAGMQRIDGMAGQNILAGEPIGVMGPTPGRQDAATRNTSGQGGIAGSGPTLYIEFRKDGQPIDPRPWLLMSDRKARG